MPDLQPDGDEQFMGFEFSAEETVCTDCDPPHPAVSMDFIFDQGEGIRVVTDTNFAREMADSLFNAVLRAEANDHKKAG